MVSRIHQIKITLRDVKPPVWRRVLVPASIRLGQLHEVIQVAMGWTDSHLHGFDIGGVSYGMPWDDAPEDLRDERRVLLSRVVPGPGRFRYDYDFGDGWEHDIVVERELTAEAGRTYPVCTAGGRACPPEDCGGPWGYAELLEALDDPRHERHRDLTSWLGGSWDAEQFDLDAVNEDLAETMSGRGTRS